MISFFVFDNAENKLKIDEYTILLIKEFKDLWDVGRNKCKEDKTGKLRLRAFKEFSYIYLTLDYKSPYFSYTEKDRHKASLISSELTEEDIKDELFLAAYHKYQELRDADPFLALIKTAYKTLHKMQVYLDSADFFEVDIEGRPLIKPKEVLADLSALKKMRTDLQELEISYKKDLAASSNKVRGDAELGAFDN